MIQHSAQLLFILSVLFVSTDKFFQISQLKEKDKLLAVSLISLNSFYVMCLKNHITTYYQRIIIIMWQIFRNHLICKMIGYY